MCTLLGLVPDIVVVAVAAVVQQQLSRSPCANLALLQLLSAVLIA
jgi:hypothetical protein